MSRIKEKYEVDRFPFKCDYIRETLKSLLDVDTTIRF